MNEDIDFKAYLFVSPKKICISINDEIENHYTLYALTLHAAASKDDYVVMIAQLKKGGPGFTKRSHFKSRYY